MPKADISQLAVVRLINNVELGGLFDLKFGRLRAAQDLAWVVSVALHPCACALLPSARRGRASSWAAVSAGVEFGAAETRLAARVILAGLSVTITRRVTINWGTPLHHLSAIGPPLRLPCALTKAGCALPSPNAAAAGCAEMA